MEKNQFGFCREKKMKNEQKKDIVG